MKISKSILAMAALLVLAAFLMFGLQGYSFSAILCVGAAGIVAFTLSCRNCSKNQGR